MQNSPLRRITFRDTCASNECPDLSLVCTVKHRWNAHASCMLRHLDLCPAVHALCGCRDFLKFLLSIPQWKMLETMEDTLKVRIFPIPSLPPLSQAARKGKSMLIDVFFFLVFY